MTSCDPHGNAVERRLTGRSWAPLHRLYPAGERLGLLDDEDFVPDAPRSAEPKGKRSIHNALRSWKGLGHVLCDGRGSHTFP